MMLMDDNLFDHWVEEKITMEDALSKAQQPDVLAKRIASKRKQMEQGIELDEDDLDEDEYDDE